MALQGANGRGLEAPEDGTRLVILIDALDELPSWLGVFITTRPEVEICDCSREREEHGGFAHFFSLPSAVKVARKARAPGHGVAVGAVPHPRPEDEGELARGMRTDAMRRSYTFEEEV